MTEWDVRPKDGRTRSIRVGRRSNAPLRHSEPRRGEESREISRLRFLVAALLEMTGYNVIPNPEGSLRHSEPRRVITSFRTPEGPLRHSEPRRVLTSFRTPLRGEESREISRFARNDVQGVIPNPLAG